MTPAKMFDGDLWVLAADATKMAENSYKKGQADEREACAGLCDRFANRMRDAEECADAIRAREKSLTG